MTKKEEFELILKIVQRSEAMSIGIGTRLDRLMDIEFAHELFNLRLKDMLEADDLNFVHDFCGIQAKIDRRNRAWLDELFVPRFAGRDRVTA